MTVHSEDRISWSTKLERIGELSAQDRQLVFNNIGHLINVDMLKEQYGLLAGNKAIGIDKVTKASYGKILMKTSRGSFRQYGVAHTSRNLQE